MRAEAAVAPASLPGPAGKAGRWLRDPGLGVYVHIPFCAQRCHYCDFNTYEGQQGLHSAYVDALEREIAGCEWDGPLATSVFFGGGTPTLLPPRALGRLLRAVAAGVGLAPGAEVTVEANPEGVDEAAFEALLEAGFNRFSIGVQSLSGSVLGALGRIHGPERALAAVRAARRAGAPEVNVDLIFGSPWESPSDWEATLAGVAALGCEHVSAYALTVEPGTPLHTLVATGRAPDVDPDVQAERHARACEVLAEAGYVRYEVSNWCRPGRACAHNVLYWSAGDYLGFGAGAHGHLGGRRFWRLRLPRDYTARAAAGRDTVDGEERLDPGARAGEALALGLRLSSGVELDGFATRFGAGALARRTEAIGRLVALGLLEESGGWLRIPEDKVLVANEVFAEVL